MNHAETTALLAICSSFDNRKPQPETVTAWLAAIGDLDFTAARAAVVAHYQESREWIMPADIRGRVRRERRDRIEDDVIPMPPGLDPDDTAAYARVLAAGRRALAEGRTRTLREPEGLTRRDLRELGQAGRANEIPSAEIRTNADRLRAEARAGKAERTEKPEPEPLPSLPEVDRLRAQLGGKPDLPPEDRVCVGCPPCPGRGNDGHGMTHCAECCMGTGVEAEIDCPVHGDPNFSTPPEDRVGGDETSDEEVAAG